MSEEPRSAQPGAEPILPHLYRVADTCNSYCIVSERRGLLIDCGAGAPTRLRESMGISDFDACLFTHHHRDVCQGAPLLAKMGVPLLVPEHERHLFEDAELHWLTRRVYDSYNDRSTYNSLVEAVPVAESLEDYSTYPWRDYELRILATPGHTWGSQSFLVEIDGQRVAFVGDLLRDGGRLHTLHDTEHPTAAGRAWCRLTSRSATSYARRRIWCARPMASPSLTRYPNWSSWSSASRGS